MSDLGPWFNATVDHLSRHWKKHLPPAAIFAGAALVLGIALFVGVMLVVGVGTVVGQSLDEDLLAIALPVTIGVSMLAALGATMLIIQPLLAGYVRYTLVLARGGAPELAEVAWGFKHIPKVLGLLTIQMGLTLIGAMFCYFPAFIVGGALMFALPAMVERDLGPIEAITRSWELARPRLASAVVAILCLTLASSVLTYVPLVGPMAAMMAFVTLPVVAWVGLTEPPSGGSATAG